MTLAERFGPGVANELLSYNGPVFYEHRERELTQLETLRDAWAPDDVPRHVELGAHRGAFLEGIARTHASSRILGIEWKAKYVRLGNERLTRRAVGNAALIHADARIAVPILLPPESVDAFYVLFPDPWWKARHTERRLLDPVFLRVLARRLRPGGRLYLKSDVFDYLYRVRASAEASGAFRPLPSELWPSEEGWTLSIRERKCRQVAIPFGRGYYQRRADFEADLPSIVEGPDAFPVPGDIDPVAIIKGPAPADREGWRKRR